MALPRKPLSEEEKKFIDDHHTSMTVMQMTGEFKRNSAKALYNYMEEKGYTPFCKGRIPPPSKQPLPVIDGFFQEGTGDWLTGKY